MLADAHPRAAKDFFSLQKKSTFTHILASGVIIDMNPHGFAPVAEIGHSLAPNVALFWHQTDSNIVNGPGGG
ncbi:MAG TPA: hypothetical protein VJQ25_08445 [Nitrospira sp.]|nr:hypothetical protein [Nitrospira sp.]